MSHFNYLEVSPLQLNHLARARRCTYQDPLQPHDVRARTCTLLDPQLGFSQVVATFGFISAIDVALITTPS
jgi:hypothetical protein